MPKLRGKKQKLRRMAARLYGQPLAIYEPKLREIIQFFEAYRAGHRYTDEELRQLGYADPAVGAFFIEGRDDNDDAGYQVVNGVAVLSLQGIIAQKMNLFMKYSGGTSTEQFSAAFDHAMADEGVRAVLIDTDSPGGEISGIDELARQIFEARGRKPIVSLSNTLMASAAYYLASAADEIVVTPSSLTGSIGTVITHSEQSKFDAELGVKYSFIHAGRHKVDGNAHEPLDKQARSTLQELVDASYEDFTAAVARNRGVSAAFVKENYGQGKVLLGKRAVDAGLADRVGTIQQVLGELTKRSSSASVAGSQTMKEETVDPKVKAALVALGLIDADAGDNVAKAALAAFCKARGVKEPTDASETVKLLGSTPTPAVSGADPGRKNKPSARRPKADDEGGEGPGPTAEDDDEDDDEEEPPTGHGLRRAVRAAVKSERARATEITARGKLLGVKQETIDAAIDDGLELGATLEVFTDELAKNTAPTQRAVDSTGVRGTGSAVDAFSAGAVEALYARVNMFQNRDGTPMKLSQHAAGLRYARTLDIAARAVSMSGVRTEGMDPDDIASAFLSMGGQRTTLRVNAGGDSYARPGDYPNILSGLLGKMRDAMLDVNTSTFREWCYQRESVPDFNARTIVALGSSGELDLIPDGEPFPEALNAEEASWISTDMYGRKGSLTPKMVANDELSLFTEKFQSDLRGHDLTINRLCVNLLIANPTLPDGNALYSANHANVVTGAAGGGPSVDQSDKMRQVMRNQFDIGGQNRLRVSPDRALIGAKWETAAEQTWLTPKNGVFPATDATINNFRGTIRPIIEQMLDDHAAAAGQVWYGFADPRLVAAIIYMYQIGFENGKVETWYDPETKCRKYTVEGRFGAAVRQWRGSVRNSGGNVSF